jgi:hypothetical protein
MRAWAADGLSYIAEKLDVMQAGAMAETLRSTLDIGPLTGAAEELTLSEPEEEEEPNNE